MLTTLALLLLLDIAPLRPAKDDAHVWAEKVQKAYNDAKDLSADVEQEAKALVAREPVHSKSRIWIEKPGKVRWEIEGIEKKTIISDGKTIYAYEPDENQVIETEASAGQSDVMLGFLGGLGNIEKDFNVSIIKAPDSAATKTLPFLKLVPKDSEDVQFASIVLGLDRKTALAQEVLLTDAMGNTTHMLFKNLQVNKAPPAKTFVFEEPKGVQVIRPAVLKKPD